MKKLFAFLILISLSAFFIYSCQKDKTYQAGESNNLRTTVTGMVLDESNAALTGVTVTAYGQTTTTNQYGTFVLKNINANKDRCVLEFSKTGFFNRAHGLIASANTVNYVRIVLLSNTSSQNFSSSTGGTVSLTDGSSAAFQPNSFVTSDGNAYTGTVNIAIKHLSPDDANFGFMIPGGDLLGKNLNDEDVALITYGMLGVELTGSSGEALQLAAGSPATLTFSIAASQLSSAPASIPLWYFDETTSLWKEEGTANKVGNNYVGTVSHFSWWNCDIGANSPVIRGKVVDCDGASVNNIVVTVGGWATTITNQNGYYSGRVPGNASLTVQVLANNNGGLVTTDSQIENVPPLPSNTTYIVPDINISCLTKIAGSINLCANESTNGFVFITDSNGFNTYVYTTNGNFSSAVLPNKQLYMKATDLFYMHSHHETILPIPLGELFGLGNISLCDSNIVSTNNFTLTGGPFTNQYFEILDSAAYTYGGVYFVISGPMPPDNLIQNLYCCVYHTTPGIYTTGLDFIISFYNWTTSTQYQVQCANDPSLILNFTQCDPPGGRVKGSFSSDGIIYTNAANPVPAHMNFNFDLLRN